MTLSSCLTDIYVFMVDVSDLANSSHAVDRNLSHFAGRKSYESVIVFLTHELCHVSCRTNKLSALAGIKLDVVDKSTDRNVSHCQSVAGLDVRISA